MEICQKIKTFGFDYSKIARSMNLKPDLVKQRIQSIENKKLIDNQFKYV